ncbi:MAG: prevent-host-death protein [Cyanobacteria bacterium J06623_5]
MYQIELKEAGAQLAQLAEEAARGEEVVITRGDGTSFRLVPINSIQATPKFGSAKGLIKIADDFNEPIEGFEEYMP